MADLLLLLDAMLMAERSEDWEQAIRLCRDGVAATSNAEFDDWCKWRTNLASLLRNVASASSIDEAISVHREITQRASLERQRETEAINRMALGLLFNNRINGRADRNWRAAIVHYENALRLTDTEANPLQWAVMLPQLGLTYLRVNAFAGVPHTRLRALTVKLRQAINLLEKHKDFEVKKEAMWVLEKVSEVLAGRGPDI